MKVLNNRAKYRLRIAATFLRQRGVNFPANGDFYGQVLAALSQHPEHACIKELVDWVEEYEPNENPTAAKKTADSAGRRKGRGTLPLSER